MQYFPDKIAADLKNRIEACDLEYTEFWDLGVFAYFSIGSERSCVGDVRARISIPPTHVSIETRWDDEVVSSRLIPLNGGQDDLIDALDRTEALLRRYAAHCELLHGLDTLSTRDLTEVLNIACDRPPRDAGYLEAIIAAARGVLDESIYVMEPQDTPPRNLPRTPEEAISLISEGIEGAGFDCIVDDRSASVRLYAHFPHSYTSAFWVDCEFSDRWTIHLYEPIEDKNIPVLGSGGMPVPTNLGSQVVEIIRSIGVYAHNLAEDVSYHIQPDRSDVVPVARLVLENGESLFGEEVDRDPFLHRAESALDMEDSHSLEVALKG